MKRVDIQLKKRSETGKGAARSARREGLIPGVVYGGGQGSVSVTITRQEIEDVFHNVESENMLVNLHVDGDEGESLALIRDAQHHPLTGDLRHLDFLRVSTDKPIRTSVPIHAVGSPNGVKEGGLFEQLMRDIEVECLPLEIPNFIELDVAHLEIGHSLHVSDLHEDPSYTILVSSDRTVASVTAPKLEVVVEEEVEGEEGEEGEGAEGAEGEEKDEGDKKEDDKKKDDKKKDDKKK